MNGGHPLIEKLTERVLCIDLRDIKSTRLPMLIPEDDWDANSPTVAANSVSPSVASMHSPRHPRSSFSGPSSSYVSGQNVHADNSKTLPQLDANWFWPMDPENPVALPVEHLHVNGPGHLPQPIGMIGCQPSQEAYVLEERDQAVTLTDWQDVRSRVS
jgi:hypothetical protein